MRVFCLMSFRLCFSIQLTLLRWGFNIFNLQETQMQKTQKKRSLMMKQGKWWNGSVSPRGRSDCDEIKNHKNCWFYNIYIYLMYHVCAYIDVPKQPCHIGHRILSCRFEPLLLRAKPRLRGLGLRRRVVASHRARSALRRCHLNP